MMKRSFHSYNSEALIEMDEVNGEIAKLKSGCADLKRQCTLNDFDLLISGSFDDIYEETPLLNMDALKSFLSSPNNSFWNEIAMMGIETNNIPPSCLKEAIAEFECSKQAVVITSAKAPFLIEYVNSAWENLCGFKSDDVKGKTMRLIQGPKTSKDLLKKLSEDVSIGKRHETTLINYKKSGEEFKNRLSVKPLKNIEGKVSHFYGILTSI